MAYRCDNSRVMVTKFKDCFLFYRDTMGFDVLYIYHLAVSAWAAMRDQVMTLKYLQQAADRGGSTLEVTQGDPHFQIMDDLPEWSAILVNMEKNST